MFRRRVAVPLWILILTGAEGLTAWFKRPAYSRELLLRLSS
jgi:hypothetical protein